MQAAVLVLLAATSGATPLDARTLDGSNHAGTLVSLDKSGLSLETASGPLSVPLADLHEIRFGQTPDVVSPLPEEAGVVVVRLRDGSVVTAADCTATRCAVTLKTSILGDLSIPRNQVSSLLLTAPDMTVASDWASLLERTNKRDLVVVRKGDRLDYIDGVVGTISDTTVNLLIDDSPVDVPRERVFGVIYASEAAPGPPLCRIDLRNGDRIAASSLIWEEDGLQLERSDKTALKLPLDLVARIDFSLGKIRYLGDDEPASITYPTSLDAYDEYAWALRRNRNSAGRSLLVGGKAYDRGVWIHSGTTLTYRLSREYRHFRALLDMDEDIGSDCDPSVGVVIRGDGRVLFERDVKWADDPLPLDLDVTGVRDLVIEVTSTNREGTCEHLDLAEARVIR